MADEFETLETRFFKKIALVHSIIIVLEARSFSVSDELKEAIKNEPAEKLNNLLANAAVASNIDDFCQKSNLMCP